MKLVLLLIAATLLSACSMPLSLSKDADYRYEHTNVVTGETTNFSIESRRDVAGPASITVAPDGTVSVTTGGLTAREQQAVDSALSRQLLCIVSPALCAATATPVAPVVAPAPVATPR